MVLNRPEIPLHTNGSERDIRCQVIRRKIGGGTRSNAGRDCPDAFLGLMHTCARLGITFWDYLGNRLRVAGHADLPVLARLTDCRGSPSRAYTPGVLPRLPKIVTGAKPRAVKRHDSAM
jgi:hypothetical protein